MEKIYDYKVVVNDNNHGIVMVKRNIDTNFEELCDLGDVSGKSAVELNEMTDVALKVHELEVCHELVSVWEDSMKEQKGDLGFVRRQMKKVLKELAEEDVSFDEKKDRLAIYQTMCAASQQIVNASKLEYAFENLNTMRKRIK